MVETIPGGLYRDGEGNYHDAEGRPVKLTKAEERLVEKEGPAALAAKRAAAVPPPPSSLDEEEPSEETGDSGESDE
jgi:hypothetical protein